MQNFNSSHGVCLFIYFLVIIAVASLFHFCGQLDIHFSNLFYLGDSVWKLDPTAIYVKYLGVLALLIPVLSIFAYTVTCVLQLVKKVEISNNLLCKFYHVLAVSFFGIVFIVRFFLKSLFNRPRPFQVEDFGGDAIFKPLFCINDFYIFDSSFSSTHAACGFFIFALAFMTETSGARRCLISIGILVGGLVGLSRVMSGVHFFSDVIFSGFFIYMTSYISAIIFGLNKGCSDRFKKEPFNNKGRSNRSRRFFKKGGIRTPHAAARINTSSAV